jgi:hypothetical protein
MGSGDYRQEYVDFRLEEPYYNNYETLQGQGLCLGR